MKRSINHPVLPTASNVCSVLPTNFFVLFSEVSTKDKSAQTEPRRVRSGRAGFAV